MLEGILLEAVEAENVQNRYVVDPGTHRGLDDAVDVLHNPAKHSLERERQQESVGVSRQNQYVGDMLVAYLVDGLGDGVSGVGGLGDGQVLLELLAPGADDRTHLAE